MKTNISTQAFDKYINDFTPVRFGGEISDDDLKTILDDISEEEYTTILKECDQAISATQDMLNKTTYTRQESNTQINIPNALAQPHTQIYSFA